MNTIYQQNGYRDRKHYLECLAEDYGVPLSMVQDLAITLGPVEDFDGLVVHVAEYSDILLAEDL